MKLPIVRPTFPAFEKIAPAFNDCLLSGLVTNSGASVQEFEHALTGYLGTPTITFNNGQTALMVMLKAAGIEPGDHVLVPAFTFPATIQALEWVGAHPVFCDIDETLCIDPNDVERKVTGQTTAILGVDVYGFCCDYPSLEAIGAKHGLKVLFDSAPAFGSRYKGAPIGGHGDAQIFSFHATKSFTTMEGGALSSRNTDLMQRAKRIRNFGQDAPGKFSGPGLNGKMMEVCAIVGLNQLPALGRHLYNRHQRAYDYISVLIDIPKTNIVICNCAPVWLYFPLIIDPDNFGCTRDELITMLAAVGVGARAYYTDCDHFTSYGRGSHAHTTRSQRVARNVVALPIYNDMTAEEVIYITDAIKDIHRKATA